MAHTLKDFKTFILKVVANVCLGFFHLTVERSEKGRVRVEQQVAICHLPFSISLSRRETLS